MTVFWSLAAVMSLLALLFLVTPLLRNRPLQTVDQDALNAEVARARLTELDMDLESGRIEQAQYDAARADLERELLHDLAGERDTGKPVRSGSWAALLIAIAVPVGATLLYKAIGTEQIIALLQENPPAARQEQAQAPQMSVEEMVSKLATRMANNPDDLKGWLMLAKSYSVTNRFDEALPAYRNIMRLGGGDNAAVLADFADALASSSDGRFTDEAGKMLTRALALEPDNLKALWLAGHWKNQSGDAAGAIGYWEQAASQMQPQSEDWQIITDQIERVRQRAGLPAGATQPVQVAQASETAPSPAASGGTPLQVTVSLDPALRERTDPDDTVFIFARAVNGPRMPLAIVRKQVKDLPVTVTLDDSLAMSPTMVLSGFDPVSVGARISKSGTAMPQRGDLQGSKSPVSPAATASVDIVIDSDIPETAADGSASPPKPVAQTATSAAAPAAAPAGSALQVTVSLDPALSERTRPDDTVFIFARAVNGPRMPLAIVRKQVKDLPVTVTLDDSLAMSPAMVLSGFDPVSVGARISRSGNAMPQSGDLQGTRSPVSTGASASLELVIDSAVP